MRSAPNVNEGGERKTPLAGLGQKAAPAPPAEQAHLASRGIEGRYSAFYKSQLRLAVFDDYAGFSGGVHKYADHIVTVVLAAEKKDPIPGFQDGWVLSPDEASHPFHGRNLRNFFAGKDSAHAIWAVLDLYIKLTKPALAQGFKLDGYLERLGLTVGEFAGAETFSGEEPDRLYSLPPQGSEIAEGAEEFLFLRPLAQRRYGLARYIRRLPASEEPDEMEILSAPQGLEDRRTASGLGIFLPLASGGVVLVKDPDTEALIFGRLAPDHASITLSMQSETAAYPLKEVDRDTVSRDLLTSWTGDTE